MKTFRFFIILIVLLCAFIPVFAQDAGSGSGSGISAENESEVFYVNIPVEKIYPYQKGYVVLYRKGIGGLGETYIPLEWFSDPDGKADLIRLGSGKRWPYLTVFYKDGEFSHLRLYVRREMNHETWGNIPLGVNLDSRFEGVETIILDF